MKTEAAIRSS